MRFKRIGAAGLIASTLAWFPASAQDPPSFHQALDRFAESRKEIRTYHLVATAGFADGLEPIQLTNGAIVDRNEVSTSYVLEVIVDTVANKRLVFCDQKRNGVEDDALKGTTAALRVTAPDYTIRANRSRGTVRSASNPPACCEFSLTALPSFDPLALGFGFAGDIDRGQSWKTVLRNYRKWPPRPAKHLADGIVRYGGDDRNRPDFIELDERKGMVPKTLKHPNGRSGVYSVDLKYTSVNRVWLPSFATVLEQDRVEVIEFSWNSVNEDVSRFFTIQGIEDHFGIELRDQR